MQPHFFPIVSCATVTVCFFSKLVFCWFSHFISFVGRHTQPPNTQCSITFVYSRNKILIHHCVRQSVCVCVCAVECRCASVAYFIFTFCFIHFGKHFFYFCYFCISLMQLHNKFIELNMLYGMGRKQCNFVYMCSLPFANALFSFSIEYYFSPSSLIARSLAS